MTLDGRTGRRKRTEKHGRDNMGKSAEKGSCMGEGPLKYLGRISTQNRSECIRMEIQEYKM